MDTIVLVEGPPLTRRPDRDIRMDATQLYWWEGVRVPSDGLAPALLTSDVTWPGNVYFTFYTILAIYTILAMYTMLYYRQLHLPLN